MLIGAACAGQGVALLPEFLIEAELRSGALKISIGQSGAQQRRLLFRLSGVARG